MFGFFVRTRNLLIKIVYKGLVKPLLFLIDAEKVHDGALWTGSILGRNAISRNLCGVAFKYSTPILRQKILGIDFRNPIGLAAGFDKNAELINILPYVGFGYEEVGSITGEPCEGNPKPRLWRLKKSKGLVINYGLKNSGAEILSKEIKKTSCEFPLGINIAKTNNKETVDVGKGVEDYMKTYEAFVGMSDYITVNISCPNAYGGEPFTNPENLKRLLTALSKVPKKCPVFLKVSPDLPHETLDSIIELAGAYGLDGFVCSNLTKKRENPLILEKKFPGTGSISGIPARDLSDQQIEYIYGKTKGKFVIIGCGGIFTAEDAYRKIKLGASLLQLITGMIFEGPQVISEINLGLARLLKKDSYKNISEAVGKGE